MRCEKCNRARKSVIPFLCSFQIFYNISIFAFVRVLLLLLLLFAFNLYAHFSFKISLICCVQRAADNWSHQKAEKKTKHKNEFEIRQEIVVCIWCRWLEMNLKKKKNVHTKIEWEQFEWNFCAYAYIINDNNKWNALTKRPERVKSGIRRELRQQK